MPHLKKSISNEKMVYDADEYSCMSLIAKMNYSTGAIGALAVLVGVILVLGSAQYVLGSLLGLPGAVIVIASIVSLTACVPRARRLDNIRTSLHGLVNALGFANIPVAEDRDFGTKKTGLLRFTRISVMKWKVQAFEPSTAAEPPIIFEAIVMYDELKEFRDPPKTMAYSSETCELLSAMTATIKGDSNLSLHLFRLIHREKKPPVKVG